MLDIDKDFYKFVGTMITFIVAGFVTLTLLLYLG